MLRAGYGRYASQFLSTLSSRRATVAIVYAGAYSFVISIHALLAESDEGQLVDGTAGVLFLSTLSSRRATHRFHHGEP